MLPNRRRLSNWQNMARFPSQHAPDAEEMLQGPASPGKPPRRRLRAEEQTLLSHIIAFPHEDEPRLDYARWLIRRRRPRGLFIQAQITGDHASARELLEMYQQQWDAEFAPWNPRDVDYVRGFAEKMSLTGRTIIANLTSLSAVTPLRSVKLVAVRHIFQEFCELSTLHGVQEIDLSGNLLTDDHAPWLLEAPWLEQCSRMVVHGNRFTMATLERLQAKCPGKIVVEPSSDPV